MITKPSKFLMSEEGASPGGGAAPVQPAEPTAAPTAPAFDVESLVSRVVSAISTQVDEKITASQNATHAALRKAGLFDKAKPAEQSSSSSAQPTQSAPVAAQAGVSLSDVESLLERRDIVATRAGKYGLSESQRKRFESAMANVPRESLATEADAYLNDMGLAKAPPQPATQQQTQTAPAQPAKPNISDRGAAAPTDLRDSEGVLNSRPLEMTGHDVDALILKYGPDKGMQMFQERVLAALGSVRLKSPNGRQR